MSSVDPKHVHDPRFAAGVVLLGRTGAKDFRVAFSPEDDGDPTVWYACATWDHPKAGKGAEAAAAMDPLSAVMRLCAQVVDGGECDHCHRPSIFDENPTDSAWDDMLNMMGCVYAWDPELRTFRRACEGDT